MYLNLATIDFLDTGFVLHVQATSPHDSSHIFGQLGIIAHVFLQLHIVTHHDHLLLQKGTTYASVGMEENFVKGLAASR